MLTGKNFSITKTLTFDAGHRIPHHASKCRNVHGHTYELTVTVEGPLIFEGLSHADEGMVMDFGDLKIAMMEEIHDRWDHRFLKVETDDLFNLHEFATLKVGEPECLLGALNEVSGIGIVQELLCVPTAENLAYICHALLSRRLNKNGVTVTQVRLKETPTSIAQYPA